MGDSQVENTTKWQPLWENFALESVKGSFSGPSGRPTASLGAQDPAFQLRFYLATINFRRVPAISSLIHARARARASAIRRVRANSTACRAERATGGRK